jgi:2-iminobutanoate/2-iminopropanoate deaminase
VLQPARLSVLILALVSVAAARANAQAAGKTVIGNSTATLSPATRVGDLIFVSGQLGGRDSTIQGQTTNALNTIKTILEGAGSSMANVAKCTVFLVDFKDFQGMNQAYSAAFPKEPPARSTVIVAALVSASAKVEIECIASAK